MKYLTILYLISLLYYPSIASPDIEEFIVLSGTISGSVTNALDTDDCSNGAISLDISNSAGPFYIEWSNGDLTEDIDGLSPGEYCVTVTDNLCGVARGCWEVKCCPFFLEDEQIEYIISNPACEEGLGELELIISNVDAENFPLSVYVENQTDDTKYVFEIASNINSFSGLSVGEYTAQLNYGEGCAYLFEFDIELNTIEIQFEKTPSCDNDGTIESTVSGGIPPYTFTWTDDETETTTSRSGLNSKFYTLIVTDSYGCANSSTTYVKDADPIILADMEYVIYNAACTDNDGSISIYTPPSGGSAPFTYAWSNGSTGQSQFENGNVVFDLAPGNYSVTITDVEGCVEVAHFDILADGLPDIDILEINHTCDGEEDGFIALQFTAYTINWSTGETGNEISDLAQGVYYYTVTDTDSGCSLEESIEIEILNANSNPITASTVSEPNCVGLDVDNGRVSLTVSGGVPPYSYHWSTGSPFKNIHTLSKGDYTVTVTDHCGLTGIFSDYVDATEILANSTWELNFGEITISTDPNGGEAPYSYAWENNETSQNITVTEEGTYKVTITDANGCLVKESIDISLDCTPLAIVLKTPSEGYDCDNSVLLSFDKKPGNSFLEGTAPFNVKVEKQNNQDWEALDNYIIPSLGALSEYLYYSTTTGTYKVTVIDNCGDTFEEVYEGCLECTYDFYTGGGDNDEVYVDIFDGMVTLEQVCPCTEDCDSGFTHDKIKLYVDESALENSLLPWNQFNFTILWPGDQENTTITKFWSGNEKKVKITGPTKYVLTTDEFYSGITVKVQYNLVKDGNLTLQCQADIPFTFGQMGYNGYFSKFEIDEGYFNPFPAYGNIFNIGTIACSTECVIPLVTGELYANEPIDFNAQANYGDLCGVDPMDPLIFYRYEPTDDSNPCTSGGRLETHLETENGIVRGFINIPAGVSLDQFSSSFPLFSDGNSYYDYSCPSYEINKGYCLFDALDVYGISLNHKLLVEYCPSSTYDPPVDTDGDGLPDDVDPCPTNPDVFCEEDEGGGSNTGGTVDENGCVTNFHRTDCQLSKVCPDEEVEYTDGTIEEETFAGMSPCIHCFTAEICRVTDFDTGIEYSSIVGPLLNQVAYTITDGPDCPSNCSYEYKCLITGEILGYTCTEIGCTFTPTVWEPICEGEEYDGVISLLDNEGDTQSLYTWLSEDQAMRIINQYHGKKMNETITLTTVPNPSSSIFSIRITSPKQQNNTLSIKNILGEEVYSKAVKLIAGINTIDIDHSFISGLYYISVTDAHGISQTIKHIIQ